MEAERGSVKVGPGEGGTRLDTYIVSCTGLSRSRVQKLIAEGHVLVAGAAARKNHVVALDEEISWEVPPPPPEEIVPQSIPLDVAYEDGYLVVVDKPAGMSMYPGPGHPDGTLLNALLALFPDISSAGGRGRPGVFHRLDRDTSGLVCVARTDEAYNRMVEKMQAREVERTYTALVTGTVPVQSGTIDAPMGRSRGNRKAMAVRHDGGRPAVSTFEVKERFARGYTLVQVKLETGRTHQIRVHFSYIGHPVAGDPEYSRGQARRELGLERQFLHASHLSFDHPMTGERVELASELPRDLQDVLRYLRS